MSTAEIVLLVAAVLALLALGLWSVAQRLDRLHRREFQTRATLEAHLVRRADTAAELATSGCLDPASAVLVADAALGSMGAARLVGEDDEAYDPGERELVESELTRTLRAALDGLDSAAGSPAAAAGPEPERSIGTSADTNTASQDVIARTRQVQYRVHLARRFHNDAVVQIHQIRRLALVRWFRLAGYAALPTTFEMDDAPV